MTIDRLKFEKEVFKRNPPGSLEKLKKFSVGIAGAGGLGSNIAIALARSGVHRLVIADFDSVELSNLNRQQYSLDQVGMRKTEALKENLFKINPFLEILTRDEKIGPDNVESIFGNCDILAEAFDLAEMKAMLAEQWARVCPDKYMVMGSGLASYGMNGSLATAVYGNLVICGDQKTECVAQNGLIAPRVAIVASMQANAIIEILLNGGIAL